MSQVTIDYLYFVTYSMEEKKAEIANYLRSKISPLITPLMEKLAKQRPDDILLFAKAYIQDLIQKRHRKQASESDSELSEDDEVAQLELHRKIIARNQNKEKKVSRMGISAQSYGIFNRKEEFTPTMIPKDNQTKIKILELIQKSILFENLADDSKKIVIDAMKIQTFEKGKLVIKEGEEGDVLYLVDSGEYECSKVINQTETYLKTYKTGEYFGELALMYTAPRAASIRCSKNGTLYALDRCTFKHIIQESATKKRQKLSEVLSKVAILSEIDPNEKEQLCDIVKSQIFESGSYIVREGEEGNKFYIVADGKLIAEKKNQKVYEFTDGDYFGEIALVRNTPRQASIKCITKCHVLSIERDAFKRMFGPIEDILKRNQEKYYKFMAK